MCVIDNCNPSTQKQKGKSEVQGHFKLEKVLREYMTPQGGVGEAKKK